MARALTAYLALLVATSPGIALGEDDAAGPLAEGDRVRLVAPALGSRRVIGHLLAVRVDGLRLKLLDGRELEVGRADIQRLEVARGLRSHTAEGAAIGALAGAAVLLGLLIADRGVCDEDLGGCQAYGLAAGIGAIPGALLGGLTGLHVRTDRWTKVPQARRAALRVGPTAGKGVAVAVSIAF